MNLTLILLYAGISFLISFLFFPVFIKLLRKWEILDSTTEHQIHSDFTPSMGGISILLGVALALLMSLPLVEWIRLKYFFISIALMFLIGLRDDILALNPKQKLISQLLPVFIIVYLDGNVLTSFYGSAEGIVFYPLVSWVVTIVTLVIVTNAYNLIDGVDGLAGTIGLIGLLFFGYWFYTVGNIPMSLISFCFAGSVLAFLYFNWQPSHIFMGDTGALLIGLLLTCLVVRFINENYHLPLDHPSRFRASIGSAICVMIIPIFDTLRVIILRLRKFQSPFRADKNHLHHQFLNIGFTHARTVFILAAVNIFFIAFAWVFRDKGDLFVLGMVVPMCLVINYVVKRAQPKDG